MRAPLLLTVVLAACGAPQRAIPASDPTPSAPSSGGTVTAPVISLAHAPVQPPAKPATVVAIAAGAAFTCARFSNGQVACWGQNESGQLGLGDTENRGDKPGQLGAKLATVDLGTGRSATAIDAGGSHVCAILDTGAVKCWGQNVFGQLGDEANTKNRGDKPDTLGDRLPTVDLGGHTAVAIATGPAHSCAILDSGAVQCWGSNSFGELGQRDAPQNFGPSVPLAPLGRTGPGVETHKATVDFGGERAVEIAAGIAHTCVRLASGAVQCWGNNAFGQLGVGGDGSHLAPVVFGVGAHGRDASSTGDTAIALESHGAHTCALVRAQGSEDTRVVCWGANDFGQLGVAKNSGKLDKPRPVALGRNARALATGYSHSCAILEGPTPISCWGESGKNPRGDTHDPVAAKPALVNFGTDPKRQTAVAIAAGRAHTCALFQDAADATQVVCWGDNEFGQLGLGDTEPRTPSAATRVDLTR